MVYTYAPGRGADHAITLREDFSGILQTNGYAAYKKLAERRQDITLALCWSHARRKFFELAKGGSAPVATEALARIGQLYAIESDIAGQDPAQRLAVRREKAAPLIKDLKTRLEAMLHKLPGRSLMAEVIRYSLSRWTGLTWFLEDGRVELDTNPVERAMRPIALNRKNALFAGSDKGASYCSSHHAIDSSKRFCWSRSGSGRLDRRASACRRTSPLSISACRMIQGPPLQCWRAGRRPLAIRRRIVDLLTASTAAASSSVASPRSARSPSRYMAISY